MAPSISEHFLSRAPSAIRRAQILFARRPDRERVTSVNVAIGNVSLPMHPAMQERMRNLGAPGSPFADGVVKYTATVGTDEAAAAFQNVLASAGVAGAHDLGVVVTDGGSMAMELMVLGVCGPGGDRPILLLDPAYTNYMDMARRVAARSVSYARVLTDAGTYAPPDLDAIEQIVREERPAGLVVIPADNPTGQFLSQDDLVKLGRLCVAHDLWLISDEAYRQLQYDADEPSTIWRLTESDVPGITGSRIGIESSSKVWNACGLRVGAVVTDNPTFHEKAVAEYTANLCANALGQHVFGALAHETPEQLADWYRVQRDYYATMMTRTAAELREATPGLIVSEPQAALYSVVDVRDVAPADFDAARFVAWCAEEGAIEIDGASYTLLVAPMSGFYDRTSPSQTAARTQMRLAYVEPPERMAIVPQLFARLLTGYLERHGNPVTTA